ncbi:NAD(P)-dependent oxidoreductase [Flavobacteriaceae bacterium]|nr:hydroxyacid dehydrogenase [Flavobacteriaceae bacterium]MDB4050371.1 hydroxyacid dehydrogenase [Flavobacteriaceae bacterium]MDB4086330.1 hydroxyacid dehydrogenase [Flavobacteriaceae bacterium]MDB4240245.1 hydroxyacid dehydrogenase [Flavobacteriaceae bacterium]MDB9787313.1 hydroxyacid dehydrogenase [Flavobacteriaceae bacterium]
MKILHLDSTHPFLGKELEKIGFTNYYDFKTIKSDLKISDFFGIIIRSRISIDKNFIDKCKNLKFIARIGSGIENIDVDYAKQKGIQIISTPEGNSNAVGEHALGMLLSILNNINSSNSEVKKGIWNRESNRGIELKNKTVGLIGYGNTGKSFAKKLNGFDVNTIFYDIKKIKKDNYANPVSLNYLKDNSDIISLHVSMTEESIGLINKNFIESCAKPFWLINTSRGSCIIINDLVKGLKDGKILGAGLDVIAFEKKSFEKLTVNENDQSNLNCLNSSNNVILTPHIAGWTQESKIGLVKIALEKIKKLL